MAQPYDNDYPMGCPYCHARSSIPKRDEPCEPWCKIRSTVAALTTEVERLRAELQHEKDNAATIESCGWRLDDE